MLMPIKNDNLINGNKLLNSPIVIKAKYKLGERVHDSIIRRFKVFVDKIDQEKSNGFTVFGMLLGDQGMMGATDYDYCWNKGIEVFGDSDDVKKYLGTILMATFANDDRYWRFVQDMDKKEKVSNGEIPDATKYFATKKPEPKPKMTIMDLATKFNRNYRDKKSSL